MATTITWKSLARIGATLLLGATLAHGQEQPTGSLRSIAIDPFDPETVYTGSQAYVFESNDGGQSWTRQLVGSYPWDIAVGPDTSVAQPETGRIVYAASRDSGVYRRANDGEWIRGNGITSDVQDVGVDLNSGKAYAGSLNDIYVSNDGGLNWELLAAAIGEGYTRGIIVDPTNPNVIYVAKTLQGVFRSVDGGITWTLGNNGLDTSFIYDLDMHPDDPSILYVSSASGIFRSVDAGENWLLMEGSGSTREAAIDHNDPRRMYAVSNVDGIRYSTDGGQSWQVATAGLGDVTEFVSVAVPPDGSGRVFAGSICNGLFVSRDFGVTWTGDTTSTCSSPAPVDPPPPIAGPTTVALQIVDKNGEAAELNQSARFDVIIRNTGNVDAVGARVALSWTQEAGNINRVPSGNWNGGTCDNFGQCVIGTLPAGASVTIAVSASTSSTWVEPFRLEAIASAENAEAVVVTRQVRVVRSILTISTESGGGGAAGYLFLLALALLRFGRVLVPAVIVVGLAGCGGTKILKEPEPMSATGPLAIAADEMIEASLDRVIFRDGPGTWAKNADWDEYVVSVRNLSGAPVRLESMTVYDSMNYGQSPLQDRATLVKASRAVSKRYADQGVKVRAGANGAMIATAGAAAFATGASIAAAGPFLTGAAAGVAAAGILAAPVLITGGVIRGVNNGKVDDAIKDRLSEMPVEIGPGQTAVITAFFPLTPSPDRLEIAYDDSTNPGSLVVDTGSVLAGLHIGESAD